jgi:signal transduction histidine kinase/FixJ family two-component response regulator
MLTPDFPENEAERLTALESYEILDSASEASFDALTHLAAYILQVPITLVSLLDKDRQWFKSRQGLDVTETHRDLSFCGHVVASAEFMVVPNASEDLLFHDNPLVTGEPRVRFYVGMPLKTSEGHILGTLCAIDNVPRQITDEQVELLGMLAAQVMALLELRRAEGAITSLSNEVHQRAAELQVANGELLVARLAADAANRAKSAFLANMSHEIRTPMNAVLGFTHLLQREGSLTEPQQQYADTIMRAGKHLLTLITDILEYSKIEAGRVSVEEVTFDLHAMLDDLDATFRLPAEQKGVRLLIERVSMSHRPVITDETRLRQILQNLLSNAVKFTEHGGVALRAIVRSESDEATTARLVVEVEDTGLGIAPEEMGKLFQVFEQTESGRRTKSGTGLGLSISRKFAELLGGSLSATSELGQGSTFRLELPIREGSATPPGPATKLQRVLGLEPGPPVLVLVVDDREDNRAFLATLLGTVGFLVRQVEDGEKAVREFETWKPDLILMDLRMPTLSGANAIGRIRGLAGGSAVKIIAVTASAFQKDRLLAIEAGADDYLSKPFREESLFDKIQALLGVSYVLAETPHTGPLAASRPSVEREVLLTREDVAVLPADLRGQLRQAILIADLDAFLVLLQEVEAYDANVARSLRGLAVKFSYPQLLDVLRTEKGES